MDLKLYRYLENPSVGRPKTSRLPPQGDSQDTTSFRDPSENSAQNPCKNAKNMKKTGTFRFGPGNVVLRAPRCFHLIHMFFLVWKMSKLVV